VGKRAQKKFSCTQNPLKRVKTSTQETLANPKPTHKGKNEHARSPREPETHSKRGKRARKKFSRTRNRPKKRETSTQEFLAYPKPTQKGKTSTQEALLNPKPTQKGENRAPKRSACILGEFSSSTTKLHNSTPKHQP
jgi:hypothetical protein